MNATTFDSLARRMGRRGAVAAAVVGMAALTPLAGKAQSAPAGHVLDPCSGEGDCIKRLKCVRGRCRIRTGDHCDNRLPNSQCARGFCATGRKSPRNEPVCQRRGKGDEPRK